MNYAVCFRAFVLLILIGFFRIKAAFIDVDTRVGYPDEFKSFVYDYQVTYTAFGRIIGDVELRAGLIARPIFDDQSVLLGMTPPLKGRLQLADGTAHTSYYLINDLTLGSINFAGTNTPDINNGLRSFDFNITGSNTIFMTKDITLDNLTIMNIISSSGGVLNGNNNKFALDPHVSATGFAPTILSIKSTGFNGAVRLKNIILEGLSANASLQSNFQIGQSTADIFFENVGLVTYIGETAFLQSSNGVPSFIGPHNFIGFGGNFVIANATFVADSPIFKIAARSRLTVAPSTIVQMAAGNTSSLILEFADQTSELVLNSCTLQIGSSFAFNNTIKFLRGTVYINGNVTLQASPGSQLQLGDGVNPANNCNIIILPGSKLIISDGATLLNMNV